jgi:tetratricopeptide (TPR) repeat protein
VAAEGRRERDATLDMALANATAVAEALRDAEEWELLASHYDAIGAYDLRDKYVEKALEHPMSDESSVFLRGMQERPEMIPAEVIEREEARLADQPSQLARLYDTIGRHQEAVRAYALDIIDSIDDGNPFSAAYYLKELAKSGLIDELFVLALGDAGARGDLWWQVRALQELGWESELDELLQAHREEVEASRSPDLRLLLARADGDAALASELIRRRAELSRSGANAVFIAGLDSGDEEADEDADDEEDARDGSS